jgi:hypothetical protein
MNNGEVIDQGPPDQLYRNPLLFHGPDAERAPQIAELLFALEQDGLAPSDAFSAREEAGIQQLESLLAAAQARMRQHV